MVGKRETNVFQTFDLMVSLSEENRIVIGYVNQISGIC